MGRDGFCGGGFGGGGATSARGRAGADVINPKDTLIYNGDLDSSNTRSTRFSNFENHVVVSGTELCGVEMEKGNNEGGTDGGARGEVCGEVCGDAGGSEGSGGSGGSGLRAGMDALPTRAGGVDVVVTVDGASGRALVVVNGVEMDVPVGARVSVGGVSVTVTGGTGISGDSGGSGGSGLRAGADALPTRAARGATRAGALTGRSAMEVQLERMRAVGLEISQEDAASGNAGGAGAEGGGGGNAGGAGKGMTAAKERVMVENFIKYFNGVMAKYGRGGSGARIVTVRGKRLGALRQRIREFGRKDVGRAVELMAKSDFLSGENKYGRCFGIDWLLRPENMAKVLEGMYERHTQAVVQAVVGSEHTASAKETEYMVRKSLERERMLEEQRASTAKRITREEYLKLKAAADAGDKEAMERLKPP